MRSADVSSGRRFVRMTFRQDGRTTLDVLSGLCLTTLDVLSGRIHVRRFVRETFCQESEWLGLSTCQMSKTTLDCRPLMLMTKVLNNDDDGRIFFPPWILIKSSSDDRGHNLNDRRSTNTGISRLIRRQTI